MPEFFDAIHGSPATSNLIMDKMILNKMQLFSEGGEYMKISRLVVSAVSLAVSAAMLTLSIIDLIRNDEY